jgi:penicillin-binding protein 1A
VETSFKYLDAFDFKKVSKKDHHASSAIGGFEYGMSPLELTNAYTSFHDGNYQPARAITFTNGKTAPRRFGTNAP